MKDRIFDSNKNMGEPNKQELQNSSGKLSRNDFLKITGSAAIFGASVNRLNRLFDNLDQVDYPLATLSTPTIDIYLDKFSDVLNVPREGITPITITAGAKDFQFVSIPPIEMEDGTSTSERLFMLLEKKSQLHGSGQNHFVELSKSVGEIGGQEVVSWIYKDENINPRPSKSSKNPEPTYESIITFALMTPDQWSSNDPKDVLNQAIFFTPPSNMEWMVNWMGLYSRQTSLPFIIPIRGNRKNFERSEVLFKPVMFKESPKIPFDQMTEEQKIASAPLIEGLSKEFYKNNQIIYKDKNGVVKDVYNGSTKETITIPENYIFFDINQFPDSDTFLKYSGDTCALSFPFLGGDAEGILLEKALELPEKYLWQQEPIAHWIQTIGYDHKCTRLFHSSETDFQTQNFASWGQWKGVVRIAYLTSVEGKANIFVYYP